MRALKALVIGLGLLIVAGTVLVAVKVIEMAGDSAGEGPGFGTLGLGMAASCQVAAAVDTEAGLVLRYSGPAQDGCDVLHVIDPAAGRVLGTIAPHAAAPAPTDQGG